MNVKQWISDPVSSVFQLHGMQKVADYQGGFEPIPDVVIFSPAVAGDWRRRNWKSTLRHMLLAIEVKASERHAGRLSRGEIIADIAKLAEHREEVRHRGGEMCPVMMIIDTAPITAERMRPSAFSEAQEAARQHGVLFYYVSPEVSVSPPSAPLFPDVQAS